MHIMNKKLIKKYSFKMQMLTSLRIHNESLLEQTNNLESSNPVAYSRSSSCTAPYFPFHPDGIPEGFVFSFSLNRNTIMLIKLFKPNFLKSHILCCYKKGFQLSGNANTECYQMLLKDALWWSN
jgi:hypothetical protein